jgi:hypothetical protein
MQEGITTYAARDNKKKSKRTRVGAKQVLSLLTALPSRTLWAKGKEW